MCTAWDTNFTLRTSGPESHERGPQFSVANFSKFHRPVCHITWHTRANFPHSKLVINFLWPPNPTKYAVFVTGNCNWHIHSVHQSNMQHFRQAQLNIFSIPPIRARVIVVYFMVKSCTHTVWRPELDQNLPYCPLHHWLVPNSANLCDNREIVQRWANSVAQLENSVMHGKLWSLLMKCKKSSKCRGNNQCHEHLHFPDQHHNFQGSFQTFLYI